MITCASCGYRGAYTSPACPVCGKALTFTDEDLAARLLAVRSDLYKKEPAAYEENCRVLADAGVREGVHRLGALLEEQGRREEALSVFRRVMPNDTYATHRYACLLSSTDEGAARFFLQYAALMGHPKSGERAGAMLLAAGREEEAVLFYRLAEEDSPEAQRALLRYYAAKPSTERHAKWYLSRLPHAWLRMPRLAFSLRHTAPEAPPAVSPERMDACLLALLNEAKERAEREVYATLCQALLSRGRTEWQATYAQLLIAGDGIEANVPEGIALLHALAERGDTAAAIRLGDLYRKGHPIPTDTRRAMRYYECAAEFGDSRGYERLADMHRAPTDGATPDTAKAIELYERAAKMGSADASHKLHALRSQRESYYLRAMTERTASPKDAYRHFVAAAEMGYTLAEVRIGDCYLAGIGVPPDRRRAFLWYRRAAEHKLDEAFYPLALCYARGVGTPLDYRRALVWLRRAHAVGCAPAMEEATRLLGAVKRKKERALHACVCELLYQGKGDAALPMAELSASFGDGKAIYTLAAMAEFGIGMPADSARARTLYEKAAACGFTDERAAYKRILLRQINAHT